jgi:mannose/fructose/N-acetylgalactosamine-specific phosphotransferase system component IIB
MVVLTRLDDRLIHGQVVVGWGRHLDIDCFVVANDQVARDPMQRKLLPMAVPKELEVLISEVDEAPKIFQSDQLESKRVLLLFATPVDVKRYLHAGGSIPSLNIGGMRPSVDKVEIHKYVSASPRDISIFWELNKIGLKMEIRLVPSERGQNLIDLLPRDMVEKEEMVAMLMNHSEIRLVSLAKDGTYSFLDRASRVHNIYLENRLDKLGLKRSIAEFEELVNNRRTTESQIQRFFEDNPDFIINDDYKKAHAHVVLGKGDGSELIPDFMLEPVSRDRLCDILEIKLPKTELFVLKKNRARFSSAVHEACAQLREYRDYFENEMNRSSVKEKFGLEAFRPQMIVVIGRRGKVSPIEFSKISSGLPDIQLKTYDDLLQKMHAKLKAQ